MSLRGRNLEVFSEDHLSGMADLEFQKTVDKCDGSLYSATLDIHEHNEEFAY